MACFKLFVATAALALITTSALAATDYSCVEVKDPKEMVGSWNKISMTVLDGKDVSKDGKPDLRVFPDSVKISMSEGKRENLILDAVYFNRTTKNEYPISGDLVEEDTEQLIDIEDGEGVRLKYTIFGTNKFSYSNGVLEEAMHWYKHNAELPEKKTEALNINGSEKYCLTKEKSLVFTRTNERVDVGGPLRSWTAVYKTP